MVLSWPLATPLVLPLDDIVDVIADVLPEMTAFPWPFLVMAVILRRSGASRAGCDTTSGVTYRLLYDIAGAAEMLSTSERRIDELHAAGRLPSVFDGEDLRFTHEDLRAYADSLSASQPSTSRGASSGRRAASADRIETPWLTAETAAEYSTVSVWTIRQAAKDGELPSYAVGKGGRHYRFNVADIDRWMSERSWEPQ